MTSRSSSRTFKAAYRVAGAALGTSFASPSLSHPPLCAFLVDFTCTNGHHRTYKCHQGPLARCLKCEKAAEQAEQQRRKGFEKQQLDAEIDAELEAQRERERARQRSDALALADLGLLSNGEGANLFSLDQ